MAYPSTLSTLATPQPTDRLNSPSHSGLHQNENTAITEIETFVGTLSSTVGTLVYDIRATASNGGGHIQTANKGGTGQTAYNKGDVLIATSSSVLTKLAVSSTAGQVLTVDPTQATGIAWATPAGNNKIAAKNSVVSLAAGQTSVTTYYFSASVLGSTLGTTGGITGEAHFTNLIKGVGQTIDVTLVYGPNNIATIQVPTVALNGVSMIVQSRIVSDQNASQFGVIYGDVMGAYSGYQSILARIIGSGTASVNSYANQTMGITAKVNSPDGATSVVSGLFIAQKIF